MVVKFNSDVYGLNAIKKSAYKFRRRLSVLVERRDHINEVRLIPYAYRDSLYALVREFCNEVLDQELRERVAREMVGIRNLLLAQASPKAALANCA